MDDIDKGGILMVAMVAILAISVLALTGIIIIAYLYEESNKRK